MKHVLLILTIALLSSGCAISASTKVQFSYSGANVPENKVKNKSIGYESIVGFNIDFCLPISN